MKRSALAAVTFGVVLASGISVSAMQEQGTPQQNPALVRPRQAKGRSAVAVRQLRRLDKDGSGTISREEWPRRPEAFDRLDANKDGQLTPEEVRSRFAGRKRR